MSHNSVERNKEYNRSSKFYIIGAKQLSLAVLVLSFSIYTLKMPTTDAYFLQHINNVDTTIFNIPSSPLSILGDITFANSNVELSEFNVFSSHVEAVQRQGLIGYIYIPESFDAEELDLTTLKLMMEDNIIDIETLEYSNNGLLSVVLDKSYLLSIVDYGIYEIQLECYFNNGYYKLEASGTIEIIDEDYIKMQTRLQELLEIIITGLDRAESIEDISEDELNQLEELINEYNSLAEEVNEEWISRIQQIKENFGLYREEMTQLQLIMEAYKAIENAKSNHNEEAMNYALALINQLTEGEEKTELLSIIQDLIDHSFGEGNKEISGEEEVEDEEINEDEEDKAKEDESEKDEELDQDPEEEEDKVIDGELNGDENNQEDKELNDSNTDFKDEENPEDEKDEEIID